ncbi:hypothetical protein P4S72_23390 [Vibrio sp. PP-XX7]
MVTSHFNSRSYESVTPITSPNPSNAELADLGFILRDTLEEHMIGKTASKREFKIHKIILFGSHAKGAGVASDIPNGYVRLRYSGDREYAVAGGGRWCGVKRKSKSSVK